MQYCECNLIYLYTQFMFPFLLEFDHTIRKANGIS